MMHCNPCCKGLSRSSAGLHTAQRPWRAHSPLSAASVLAAAGQQDPASTSSGDQQELLHAALQVPSELQDYRVNVGVCLVNRRGLVFAAARADAPNKSWQMPQGGIDPGETPVQAAMRELQEETSITSVKVLSELPRWLHYDFSAEVRGRLGKSWASYRGQTQRWFLLEFTGDDSEVNLDTAHKEFSDWCWMPLQELPGAVIPFKRHVYEAVAAEFAADVEAIAAAAASIPDTAK